MDEPNLRVDACFWLTHAALFDELARIEWDTQMKSRMTASFGAPYDYSQMRYAPRPMHPALAPLVAAASERAGFEINSCLLNYYADGRAKMGYHADRLDELAPDTAVLIVSLGAPRTLRFRLLEDHEHLVDYRLAPGSLVVVPHAVQARWQHAVPREADAGPRISVTMRRVEPM